LPQGFLASCSHGESRTSSSTARALNSYVRAGCEVIEFPDLALAVRAINAHLLDDAADQ
jgi:hypothetical protein